MSAEAWQAIAVGLAIVLFLSAAGWAGDGYLRKRLREALEERGRYENEAAARLAALQGWGTREVSDDDSQDCDGCG